MLYKVKHILLDGSMSQFVKQSLGSTIIFVIHIGPLSEDEGGEFPFIQDIDFLTENLMVSLLQTVLMTFSYRTAITILFHLTFLI